MSNQKFCADMADPFTHANGATSYGSPMPWRQHAFSIVRNCVIEGTALRLTCYATGDADTWFSIPACTQHKGKYVAGYFTTRDDGVVFCVMDRHASRVGIVRQVQS